MSNRLAKTLARARRNQEKLFCAYVTLGYPSLARTERVIGALVGGGTDILELGFPFSDPLADGPTIQRASEQAICRGVRLEDAFQLGERLRRRGIQIPILFFSYLNPIHHYGIGRFAHRLRQAGFDGAIVPDLPLEEGRKIKQIFHASALSLVYLIAPTTTRLRMRVIAARSDGFIYYVSLRGVTGARQTAPPDLVKTLHILKRLTRKPLLVGFGVSRPEQARAIARVADGIVVGSAIVERLARAMSVKKIGAYVRRLVWAMK